MPIHPIQSNPSKSSREKYYPQKPGKWKSIGTRPLEQREKQPAHQVKDAKPPQQPNVPNDKVNVTDTTRTDAIIPKQELVSIMTVKPDINILEPISPSELKKLHKWAKSGGGKLVDNPPNILFLFDSAIAGVPASLRDEVCAELKWSLPTYFRQKSPGKKKIRPLSNAQNQAICKIVLKMTTLLIQRINEILFKCYVELQD